MRVIVGARVMVGVWVGVAVGSGIAVAVGSGVSMLVTAISAEGVGVLAQLPSANSRNRKKILKAFIFYPVFPDPAARGRMVLR